MSLSKFVFAAALAAGVALPMAARADTAGCEIRTFNATQVAPLRTQERVGRGAVIERLKGAQVFVPAQQGVTAELLRARAEQHVAKMQHGSMPGCPLAVDGIQVTVVSAGTGYWVQLKANTAEGAKEVLQRAEAIVR